MTGPKQEWRHFYIPGGDDMCDAWLMTGDDTIIGRKRCGYPAKDTRHLLSDAGSPYAPPPAVQPENPRIALPAIPPGTDHLIGGRSGLRWYPGGVYAPLWLSDSSDSSPPDRRMLGDILDIEGDVECVPTPPAPPEPARVGGATLYAPGYELL